MVSHFLCAVAVPPEIPGDKPRLFHSFCKVTVCSRCPHSLIPLPPSLLPSHSLTPSLTHSFTPSLPPSYSQVSSPSLTLPSPSLPHSYSLPTLHSLTPPTTSLSPLPSPFLPLPHSYSLPPPPSSSLSSPSLTHSPPPPGWFRLHSNRAARSGSEAPASLAEIRLQETSQLYCTHSGETRPVGASLEILYSSNQSGRNSLFGKVRTHTQTAHTHMHTYSSVVCSFSSLDERFCLCLSFHLLCAVHTCTCTCIFPCTCTCI